MIAVCSVMQKNICALIKYGVRNTNDSMICLRMVDYTLFTRKYKKVCYCLSFLSPETFFSNTYNHNKCIPVFKWSFKNWWMNLLTYPCLLYIESLAGCVRKLCKKTSADIHVKNIKNLVDLLKRSLWIWQINRILVEQNICIIKSYVHHFSDNTEHSIC